MCGLSIHVPKASRYRLHGANYRLVTAHGESEVARIEPFDGVELELGALWPGSSESSG